MQEFNNLGLVFKIEDYIIKTDELLSFKVTEVRGGYLPSISLQLKVETLVLYSLVSKHSNPIIFMKLNDDFTTIFNVVSYSLNQNKEDIGYVLDIDGLMALSDYIYQPFYDSFEGSSLEALKQITGLDTLHDDIKMNDKQVWINPYNSRFRFLQKCLKHSYYNDNFFLDACISVDGKLRLKTNDYKLHKSSASFNNKLEGEALPFSLEGAFSQNGLSQLLFNAKSNFSVYNFEKGTTTLHGEVDGKMIETFYDTGNTHENYYHAFYHNSKNKVELLYDSIVINSDMSSLIGILHPLDFVDIFFRDIRDVNILPEMSNRHIISKIVLNFDRGSISNTLVVNRVKYVNV